MKTTQTCPDCGKIISMRFPMHDCKQPTKNPNAVALGRLGGKAGRGQSKARTTEQARAAVAVRWNKVKQQKQLNTKTL